MKKVADRQTYRQTTENFRIVIKIILLVYTIMEIAMCTPENGWHFFIL